MDLSHATCYGRVWAFTHDSPEGLGEGLDLYLPPHCQGPFYGYVMIGADAAPERAGDEESSRELTGTQHISTPQTAPAHC